MVETCSWVTSMMRKRHEKHWITRDGCIPVMLVDVMTKDFCTSQAASKVNICVYLVSCVVLLLLPVIQFVRSITSFVSLYSQFVIFFTVFDVY